jgi:hypothetical protein
MLLTGDVVQRERGFVDLGKTANNNRLGYQVESQVWRVLHLLRID